ncbi:hypothetical protein [Paraburkholderia sp. Ac-20347]|uniref:hypothetical protein n=1 Tax=Paraburkholderia sp. Ac-20347 TaxID=2703892 RepID=UPI0019811946|nr:hypothetical protein [Paraburkholderia sp. Ac-20347]MBN3811385.1 hypothetical protein [Paraburkholderia sp. Ac-20347]
MKFFPALALATLSMTGATLAYAQVAGNAAQQSCSSIGTVSGVGGAASSMSEYLALPERDRYKYFSDHQIQCDVTDDSRAKNCVGLTNLRNDKVSIYDDSDSVTTAVVAKIELEHGTFPAIIVVRKQDIKCED